MHLFEKWNPARKTGYKEYDLRKLSQLLFIAARPSHFNCDGDQDVKEPKDILRRDVLALLGSAAALALAPARLSATPSDEKSDLEEYPYTVAQEPWPEPLGNHRVHVYADQPAEAVWAHIPWRRTDSDPEQKAILVFSEDGSEVVNTAAPNVKERSGDVVFEVKQPGSYFIYYLPHAPRKPGNHAAGGLAGQYRKAPVLDESSWGKRYLSQERFRSLPQARTVEFQARTALDSFYPMLVPATASEVQRLCEKYPQPILLFAEDREHPIKMDDRLPLLWIQTGPRQSFSGTAFRGEIYVLQIGVYLREAPSAKATPLDMHFEELTGPGEKKIPATAWTCLNTDIVDANGNVSHKQVQIEPGKVAALWCAVQVPLEAKPGKYRGNIAVVADGKTNSVAIELEVKPEFIRAGGVDQGWRLARIGWLNSKIGSEDSRTAPYTPLRLEGRTVHCLGREIEFGEDGLPVSIRSNQQELLAAPIGFSIRGGPASWKSTSKVESASDAKVVIVSESKASSCTLRVRTTVEFDGGIGFDVKLVSDRSQSLPEIALEIPYIKESAPYAVGMGLKGGNRPRTWQWKWTDQPQKWKERGSNLEFFMWLGDVKAGLYCRLTSPLDDWRNEGKGGVNFAEAGDRVLLRASIGSRRIRAGEALGLSFRLLPTPVKPLDPQRWKYRYAHTYRPPNELHAIGATVNNIHQGTLPNMYINYPFLNLDLLIPYISESHSLGMKVKIYYTMRELTTRLPELWTFRSLHHEIYRVGGTQGQGYPQLDFWMQEHLRHDYSAGWINPTPTGGIDTSLRVYSDSRLANFYLEGLNWLLSNAQIDGLYLDEIGYTRATMQRVRRVLDRRPGAMIDMHANYEWWSCNCPIGYYMEHLPYIDRLWLGEGFDPDWPPDFWLIGMSGIPFGLSSDMLERPNPWRGMLFGMTNRAFYSGPLPTSIWKVWDSFGIEDAIMLGWWDKAVPVKTGRSDILATVYKKKGKSLVALASWAKQTVSIQLDVDWDSLGIDRQEAKITVPEMGNFQSANSFRPGQSIPVPPAKGYLLVIEQDLPLGPTSRQTDSTV